MRAVLLIAAGVLVSSMARAEQLPLTWYNPSAGQPPTAFVRLHLRGLEPFDVAVVCDAGTECSATFDVPSGCYVATLAQRGADDSTYEVWSPPNDMRAICTEVGRYDRSGDGLVTTLDFPAFRDAFLWSRSNP